MWSSRCYVILSEAKDLRILLVALEHNKSFALLRVLETYPKCLPESSKKSDES
jgi:hypothetical protein